MVRTHWGRISTEEFRAIQDVLGLNNGQMADALGLSTRTVIRYRIGDDLIPRQAAIVLLSLCKERGIATPDSWDSRRCTGRAGSPEPKRLGRPPKQK